MPARAAFDDPPRSIIASSTTLDHVRALYRLAHPGLRTKNAMLIEEWRLVQDGQTGTLRVNRLGKDYRETTILGPLVYENGLHAGVHWQQNRNGITFSYAGFHERDAISEHDWESNGERDVHLAGESVPLNAFVVEVDPPNGRHEWLFIDKKNGQIIRRDEVERNRRLVTSYDDFRPFDGESLAGHIRSVDSLGNEREQTLLSRVLDTAPDPTDVAIPATRRTLLEFPAGTSTVRLPVRFVNGLLVTHVLLDGHPYDFLLDSGAAGIVIDPIVAETLGLERFGERIGSTIGPFPETTAIVPSVTVGLLHMRNIVSRVVPIPFRADEHTHIAGLLGFDFFAEGIVHIDSARGIVEALQPASFRAPADDLLVPIALDDKQPAVRIRVGPVAARVILDTGANRSVLAAAFADRLEPADVRSESGSGRLSGIGGSGVAETVRITNLELAGVTLPDALVDISAADLGFEDIDGLIGTDLLRDYDLYFDYRNDAVYARHLGRAASIGRRAAAAAVRAPAPSGTRSARR